MAEIDAETARQKLIASYAGKMCPTLSQGMIAKAIATPPLVMAPTGVPAGQPEGELMGCQGPNCAWFCITAEENKLPVAGACAAALIPMGLLRVANTNAGIAQEFIGKYKILPRS